MRSFDGVPRRFSVMDPCGLTGSLIGLPYNALANCTSMEHRQHYVTELRKVLLRLGARRRLPQGTSLYNSTQRARHLYIVESGRIEVYLPEDRERLPVVSLRSGASFIFDFGGHQIADVEAAADSRVVDLPMARIRALCPDETDVRLLLQQVRPLDLKVFLDACYPAQGRFRLIRSAEEESRRE